jgi:hypothetical protein
LSEPFAAPFLRRTIYWNAVPAHRLNDKTRRFRTAPFVPFNRISPMASDSPRRLAPSYNRRTFLAAGAATPFVARALVAEPAKAQSSTLRSARDPVSVSLQVNGRTQHIAIDDEATEIDEKRARYVNDNLADYLVPVNADVDKVEVILVPEEDTKVNPLSIKSIGELANVGTAAAVSNAVYHATGKRIRKLPIRIEDLI